MTCLLIVIVRILKFPIFSLFSQYKTDASYSDRKRAFEWGWQGNSIVYVKTKKLNKAKGRTATKVLNHYYEPFQLMR